MADCNFLDTHKWIRQFEDDPIEVLRIRDKWIIHATEHVEDPGASDVCAEFFGMARVLTAWADHKGIDGASALRDLCRQLYAVRKPGVPWGQRQPVEVIGETMSRALGVIERITDKAFITCKPKSRPQTWKYWSEIASEG